MGRRSNANATAPQALQEPQAGILAPSAKSKVQDRNSVPDGWFPSLDSCQEISIPTPYFRMASGLISTPRPGLVGTATRPLTTLKGSVSNSRRSADSVTEYSRNTELGIAAI